MGLDGRPRLRLKKVPLCEAYHAARTNAIKLARHIYREPLDLRLGLAPHPNVLAVVGQIWLVLVP